YGVQLLDKIRILDRWLLGGGVILLDGWPLLHAVIGSRYAQMMSQISAAGANLNRVQFIDANLKPLDKLQSRKSIAGIKVTPELQVRLFNHVIQHSRQQS